MKRSVLPLLVFTILVAFCTSVLADDYYLYVDWNGGQKVLAGTMQLGVLIAYTGYLYRFFGPAKNFIGFFIEIQRVMAAADRVFKFFDQKSHIRDRKDAKPLSKVIGQVQFDHVHFSYQEGVQVLTDIDFTVYPGEMIALVGKSGAGKSTLVHLIPRFYDPMKGRILLDEIDLRDIRLDSLRQQVSMVFQDAFLFSTTVRENILFGQKDASEEEIIAAARAANAHDFIMELPQGYATEVGERGVKLSGGQKQRIAIARTILRDPKILRRGDFFCGFGIGSRYPGSPGKTDAG